VKTNKQAAMLSSLRTKMFYKLQCRTALEPTLALRAVISFLYSSNYNCCQVNQSCVDRGLEVKIPGTSCTDTVCQCRWRDGYLPDGQFCIMVEKCDVGHEMTLDGVLLHTTESY